MFERALSGGEETAGRLDDDHRAELFDRDDEITAMAAFPDLRDEVAVADAA